MSRRLALAAASLVALSATAGMALAQTSAAPAEPPAGTAAPTGQARQGGMQAIEVTPAVVTFLEAEPADLLTSDLVGTGVFNKRGERIGEVEDLVIADGKTVRALVVGVGGFLGLGEGTVAKFRQLQGVASLDLLMSPYILWLDRFLQ